MSYILDALKKSDQQRQRGAVPPLNTVQVTVAEPKRPMTAHYGLLAAVLLGVGILVGWLRPWQSEQPVSETKNISAMVPAPVMQQEAPPLVPNETFAKTEVVHAEVSPVVAPVQKKSSALTETAPQQQVLAFGELPLQIQQEIPTLNVQLHAYANQPSERLVSINNIRLREGELLMSGLRLEQITPDGMIFSYKGFRFQRGIRF